MTVSADTQQQAIAQYWSAVGSGYDRSVRHGLGDPREGAAWKDALAALLPAAPADILDVGTGTGFLAELLADLGHRVVGVDVSEGMLAEARTKVADRANAPEWRLGDAHAPGVPAASFDAVVNRHLAWTLQDPARAFRAWFEALRPGGTLLVIDALWWREREPVTPDQDEARRGIKFTDYYTPELQAALPLMFAATLDPVVAVAEAAGFKNVVVSTLEAVEQIERELAPDAARFEPRYVLKATRPAAVRALDPASLPQPGAYARRPKAWKKP